MKIFRNEEGQTLVLTALCGSVLLGFMALALDVGVLFHNRREIQTAADAAALAGAKDYLYNQSVSSARTAACSAAAANGFTGNCTTSTSGVCSGSDTVICVNLPPQSGPNTTTAGNFVEVIVKQPTSTIFRSGSITVNARAVAATPTNGQACIWLMASTGPAFDVQGSYDIEATGCGIYVNSTSTDAMGVTGNGGTVKAQFIDVVGNATLQHQTSPTPATMNSGTRTDPWGNLQGPCYDTASCTAANNVNPGQTNACNGSNSSTATSITSSTTIPPAVNGVVCFTGGSLSPPPLITGSTAFSFPGASSGVTYLFTNGVEIDTGTTVTFGWGPPYDPTSGTFPISPPTVGATLDVGNGTLKQDSSSLLNIYSPTKGSVDGIAIMQSPWNTGTLKLQFGSNNEVLDGYIYAPSGEVYMQDSGGGVTATGLVANQLFDKTTAFTVAKSYDQANPTTTLNAQIVLVE
jgi:Flp pilus assembly protein TadG